MRMKRYFLTQILLVSIWCATWLCWPGQAALATTLHAILAGNTLDTYIGQAVTQDIEQFQQELQTIAKATGMRVRRVELTGTQLRKATLMDTISGLRPNADDVVIFYFSGHGFSLRGKDQWPYMSMLDDEALDEKWVFDTLAALRPRLLMVFADSCNNVIPEAYAPDISLSRQFKVAGNVQENYQALFLHARGAILASSSQHNEVSSSFKNGSAFTLQFFSALRNAVTWTRKPTWKEVMEAATRPMWIEGQYQHPQYVEIPRSSESVRVTPTMPVSPTATPTPVPRLTPAFPTATPTPRLQQPPAFPMATPTPIRHRVPDIQVPDLSTPTPSPTPTPNIPPTPTPSRVRREEPDRQYQGQIDCEHAETVLDIELYGWDNLLRFVIADDDGHRGSYRLRDRLKEYTVFLAPGKRAVVYLHGERNELLIPHDLSLCVHYEDLGVNNSVYIHE